MTKFTGAGFDRSPIEGDDAAKTRQINHEFERNFLTPEQLAAAIDAKTLAEKIDVETLSERMGIESLRKIVVALPVFVVMCGGFAAVVAAVQITLKWWE